MDFTGDYTLTINGRAVLTSETIDVINPATAQSNSMSNTVGPPES